MLHDGRNTHLDHWERLVLQCHEQHQEQQWNPPAARHAEQERMGANLADRITTCCTGVARG
jgi:hypothetical protein